MIEIEASSDLKRLFNLNYIISNKYIIFLGKQLRLNTFSACLHFWLIYIAHSFVYILIKAYTRRSGY